MAKIEDLISEISNERLRGEIAAEVKKLKTEKKFGLVFENHVPELSFLYNVSIRVGASVVKRGAKGAEVYRVVEISEEEATIERDGLCEVCNLIELIVVKRYGEAIYPSLLQMDSLTKNPEKPYHAIINADNYHALQLLLYCYEGRVDVIYVDPPYNTGARDWKYNNNYVDANDQWRHSKWLAMMKKRLLLARRLLSSEGVLIITIDEHEVLHLGLLLSEIFPNTDQQLVTIVSNPGGSFGSNLSNVNEYAFFIIPRGKDLVRGRPIQATPSLFDQQINQQEPEPVLGRLRKRGEGSLRKDRKNMFYAVYVDKETVEPKFIGEVIPFGEKPSFEEVDGYIPVFPIDEKGVERRWNYGRETMIAEIIKGNIVAKRDRKGIIKLYKKEPAKKLKRLNTVWTSSEYAAGDYGSRLVNSIFGKPNVFPFPKSLYAVIDSIGSVITERPEAIVLDFFAGSGTTLHATCMLNAEDGGQRQCILVTNNEVTPEISRQLHADGYRLGNPEFESNGICESVTWPRCKYVINGHRDDGTPLLGKYINGREISKGFDENLAYFKLDFLDPHEVAFGSKFEAILPILWLMAGAKGKPHSIKGSRPYYFPKNSPFAVLLRERHFEEFKQAVKERDDITHIFLVTDSDEAFRDMTEEIGGGVRETFMLYKNYLDNFRINIERII